MKQLNWKYFLSEIFIVTIGILLAFELQNWKERSKQNILFQSHLRDLKSNLMQDEEQIKIQIDMLNSIDSSLLELTQLLYSSESVTLNREQMFKIHTLNNWYFLILRRTAYQDLYNSGRLNLLQDSLLKANLATYYEYGELVSTIDKRVVQDDFRTIIIQKVPFGKNAWDVPEETRLVLSNIAFSIKASIDNINMHLKNLLSINEKIIDSIDPLIED